MDRFDYIIIGNSAAGVGGCEGIRSVDKEGSLAIVSDEIMPAYSRCLITHFIAGDIDAEKLLFRPRGYYSKMNAEAIFGAKVIKIVPAERTLNLSDGSVLGYRKLLLATGASAARYDIPGHDLKGVHVLRTFLDAKAISEEISAGNRAIILGGGLVGMKAADALHARGVDVMVVISSPQVMSQTMDREGAEMIRRHLEKNGIKIRTNTNATEIIGSDRVKGIRTQEGEVLDCDLLIMAKGVTPNIDLAKGCGINVDYGIIVDDQMLTSDPDIYAAGDVAEAKDLISGGNFVHAIWPNAIDQGKIAGQAMAGKRVKYLGGIGMNSADFFGLPAISVGQCRPRDPAGFEFLTRKDPDRDVYCKIVLKDGKDRWGCLYRPDR